MAGYGAYALSAIAGVAAFAVLSGFAGAQGAIYAGVAVLFFGIFVFEPLVAWGGGVVGARDLTWEDVQDKEVTEEPPPAPAAQALGLDLRPKGTPWVGAPPLLRPLSSTSAAMRAK